MSGAGERAGVTRIRAELPLDDPTVTVLTPARGWSPERVSRHTPRQPRGKSLEPVVSAQGAVPGDPGHLIGEATPC